MDTEEIINKLKQEIFEMEFEEEIKMFIEEESGANDNIKIGDKKLSKEEMNWVAEIDKIKKNDILNKNNKGDVNYEQI